MSFSFNKKRKDFASEDDYNLYLEDIEDKIFKLCDGSEDEKTRVKKEIKDYQARNGQSIAINNIKRAEQLKILEQMVKIENKKLSYYPSPADDQEDPNV